MLPELLVLAGMRVRPPALTHLPPLISPQKRSQRQRPASPRGQRGISPQKNPQNRGRTDPKLRFAPCGEVGGAVPPPAASSSDSAAFSPNGRAESLIREKNEENLRGPASPRPVR